MQNRTNSESWQQLLEPRRSWWGRLPFGVRMTAGASVFLVVAGGGTIVVAAFIDQEPVFVADAGHSTPAAVGAPPALPNAAAGLGGQTRTGGPTSAGRADQTPEPRPTSTPGAAYEAGRVEPAVRPADANGPVVTIRTVAERQMIPFRTLRVGDWHLARGEQRVERPGSAGEKTLRYLVTYIDGRPTDRRLLKSEVTRKPRQRIIAFGIPRGHDDDGDHGGDGGDHGGDGGDHGGDGGDHGGDDGWDHGDGPDDGGNGPDNSGNGPSDGGDGPNGPDDGPNGPGDGGDGNHGGDFVNREGGEGAGVGGDGECWPGSGECRPIARDQGCPSEQWRDGGDGPPPWDEGWREA